ncbi:MAG: putative nicotinamide N-methyase [Myxococcota bacterium]|jgi:predicted nicotinamide N-methyase
MSPPRIRYQTLEFENVDIHIRALRDKQEFSDDDGEAERLGISSAQWSLFGVLWIAGEALARHLHDYNIEGLRILEVGCGLGLSSIVLNHRNADITATDYHPEAGRFLNKNTQLNHDDEIPFIRTGWADEESDLGDFDLIVGADLLYEREHAALLSSFVDQHAREHCTVILTDPGRGHQNRFGREMEALGYIQSRTRTTHAETMTREFTGWLHRYSR